MEPEGSLLHSEVHTRPWVTFCNMLQDYPLLEISDCLNSIYSQLSSIPGGRLLQLPFHSDMGSIS